MIKLKLVKQPNGTYNIIPFECDDIDSKIFECICCGKKIDLFKNKVKSYSGNDAIDKVFGDAYCENCYVRKITDREGYPYDIQVFGFSEIFNRSGFSITDKRKELEEAKTPI